MNVNGNRKRGRSTRVTLSMAPGRLARAWQQFRSGYVLVRLGLAFLTALAVWATTRAWEPPFEFHLGYVPPRDIVARVDFQKPAIPQGEPGLARETRYRAGQTIAVARIPLPVETMELLRLEHRAYADQIPWQRMLERGGAILMLVFALVGLCAAFLFQHNRRLIGKAHRLAVMLMVVPITTLLATWVSADPWRADLVPLLLAGMTFGIAYGREQALVLTLSMSLIISVAGGHSLGDLLAPLGIVSVAILQLGRIRSRRKLIAVGFYAGLVALPLTIGAALLDDQPLRLHLLNMAAQNALWTFLTGFLITGLLPFIEGLFGVVTEISLLELGDVAHPLLQELVRRAPGTYNHSINVASIAEAAADSIGAKGLLVRVGAYFHDIGKMLKPGYFVENQGLDANRHDSLVPAMSTLIIIAHVKDGADLARQHHLPEPIIDFIEQHHGTTLVEYFYKRASEQCEQNPDAGQVPESSFRYPGPKPQTVESAVLMLADAVESASRALVDPAPSRIENVVEELAMKKLLDGQFDECGLTLQQLRTVEDSLIKSLTAVYHGRIKYPDQRTA